MAKFNIRANDTGFRALNTIRKGLFVIVSVENLAPCKKLVRVEVEAQKVNDAFEEMTKSFQREAKLPGFRPGKAPKAMVEKRYETDIQDEVKKKMIPDAYRAAIKEQKIDVVGYPDIEEIQFGKNQSLQFAATIETAPEFEMPDYKGLPAKREKGDVSEEDVQKAIDLLRERQTNFQTVARELKEGDVAVVNYTGTCEGKPLTEIAPTAKGLTEQTNFWVNIDKNSFILGFAEQLIGAKAGDKRTVTVDFPADFVTPQLQGKKGIYEVEVVEVKEKLLPELNDEFAKSYGAENLEKLREGVRTDLANELKYKQERSVREQIVKGLLERVKCELPESTVVQETRNIVYNIVSENQKRGISKETIDQQKNEIFNSASATAKERVKASFLFQKIAEKEAIKVEQNDVLQRIQQLAANYQMPPDKFVKELQKRNGVPEIVEQLQSEKVIDFLVQNAKVEEVEPEQKTA
ncbi:MAG: trigger factor [Verrucomicrobiota bacterium]